MIHIAICEDEKKVLEELRNKVNDFLEKDKIIAKVEVYSQSRMLLYDIQEGKHFDLILSDIEMPGIDGMRLAENIKKYLSEVLIIFITSHLKYAIDAFELSIFRYVPKDSIAARLQVALGDAVKIINLQKDEFYVIETLSRLEKIPYKNIVYIQRQGKNSIFYLTDNTSTKIRKSLSQLYGEFNQEDFAYIDRGTIVNLAHILTIVEGNVRMTNGECLYSSQTRIEEIKNKMNTFWRKNL
ncbi:MAG: response regulator transcription factor [Tyzzerella sp.]|nr:response regulator transcription factor [Tyzzerella sp.]